MRVVIPERERVAANGEVSAKGDAVKWHATALPHHVLRTITMATADPTGDHDQMVQADSPWRDAFAAGCAPLRDTRYLRLANVIAALGSATAPTIEGAWTTAPLGIGAGPFAGHGVLGEAVQHHPWKKTR